MASNKSGPTEPHQQDLINKIISLCQENPDGLDSKLLPKLLSEQIPDVDTNKTAAAINSLLSKGQIVLRGGGNKFSYHLQNPDVAKSLKGSNTEEKVVYQIIQEKGTTGALVSDIRKTCNLATTQLNKVLKVLESKKIIKPIKSVKAPKQKRYILFELEPDSSITGGAWYSGDVFESEFVEVLNNQCYKYLQHKTVTAVKKDENPLVQKKLASASSKEVLDFISKMGISKVKLSVKDVEQILDTLIYDGKVEQDVSASESANYSKDSSCVKTYRTINKYFNSIGLMQIPCGFCPVIEKCSPSGEVSPSTCEYLQEWLSF